MSLHTRIARLERDAPTRAMPPSDEERAALDAASVDPVAVALATRLQFADPTPRLHAFERLRVLFGELGLDWTGDTPFPLPASVLEDPELVRLLGPMELTCY